jgi:peptide/nickel transport system substrate-binding protein
MFPQNVAEAVTVIFPREVLEEDGDLKKRMIGTGPFILKEHDRKVRAVLARNPDYFDKGYPYVNEYRILSTPDAATRWAAFRTGQSDILQLFSLADVKAVLKTNPTAIVNEITTILSPFGLTLRQDKPPFNDVRVRRALSMAIDRQKQVDTSTRGTPFSAGGFRTSTSRTTSPPPPISARTGSTARRKRRSSSRRRAIRTGSRRRSSTTSISPR